MPKSLYIFLFGIHFGYTLPPKIVKAIPGENTLTIQLPDTNNKLNLQEVRVKGHTIRTAAIVEESIHNPIRFQPQVIDLTQDPGSKISAYDSISGILQVRTVSQVYKPGQVLLDTSLGGKCLYILAILSSTYTSGANLYALQSRPARLEEVIYKGSFKFALQAGKKFTFQNIPPVMVLDSQKVARFKLDYSKLAVGFFPQINGAIEILNGQRVQESLEWGGYLEFTGMLQMEKWDSLPFQYSLPLVKAVEFKIPVKSGYSISFFQELKFELDFASPQPYTYIQLPFQEKINFGAMGIKKSEKWNFASSSLELVKIKNTYPHSPSINSGTSQLRLSYQSKIGLQVSPDFKFETGISADYSSIHAYQPLFGINVNRRVNTYSWVGFSNKELKENFQKLNLQESPPLLEGPPVGKISPEAMLKSPTSLVLRWSNNSKAERYWVQQKIYDSWTPVRFTADTKIEVSDLTPGSQYVFRVLPLNFYGVGEPESLMVRTPNKNNPPVITFLQKPNGESLSADSITLQWQAHDPDSLDRITYQIFLDTLSPPTVPYTKSSSNSNLVISKLLAGKNYFWFVEAFDGTNISRSPIYKFSTKKDASNSPNATPIAPEKEFPKSPGPNWVYIDSGSYFRENQSKVFLNPYFIQKTEVTQKSYQKLMGKNPSFRRGEFLPVESVSWYEAQKYCDLIDAKLPTEAQWEFAARSGKYNRTNLSKIEADTEAWYYENSENQTHPVSIKKPSPLGIHDMAGNVFEWTLDWYENLPNLNQRNPQGPTTGITKVTRGGSWYSDFNGLQPTVRTPFRPKLSSYKLGFRCVKEVN